MSSNQMNLNRHREACVSFSMHSCSTQSTHSSSAAASTEHSHTAAFTHFPWSGMTPPLKWDIEKTIKWLHRAERNLQWALTDSLQPWTSFNRSQRNLYSSSNTNNTVAQKLYPHSHCTYRLFTAVCTRGRSLSKVEACLSYAWFLNFFFFLHDISSVEEQCSLIH